MKIYKGAVFDTLQEGLEEAFKYELEHRCELNISDSNANVKRKSNVNVLKKSNVKTKARYTVVKCAKAGKYRSNKSTNPNIKTQKSDDQEG